MNASAMHDWIVPAWDAPPNVGALVTTRAGGVSIGPWGDAAGKGGLNVGLSAGDERAAVETNRARLARHLPAPPRWLAQEHGAMVADAEAVGGDGAKTVADAATSITPSVVCAVQIADCLPVLLADTDGTVVGAAHAGWRGLAAGVIQNTVRTMRARTHGAARIVAYLGPAIGPRHFEVGPEVLAAMRVSLRDAEHAFVPASAGKFHADLFALAKMALRQVGVEQVAGGGDCTFSDTARFYSYRRDGVTGRQAALVWIRS
ncbi:MAG TPA: peptidoglycan editing factor PgeF, partial [Burkholderiaceae bacterium]|nr:peptidoglycan editing factor PgeF [Burkholderiaceae bacterium]